MANAQTTVQTAMLYYRPVGSEGEYKKLRGLLKGFTLAQDEPDSTEIEAEFFDTPWDIVYDGNPITMNFELANYALNQLPQFFGGTYDAEKDRYEGATSATTTEWEWVIEFKRGHKAFGLYRGLTVGTPKKDEDGAFNYAVTITSMLYTDSEDNDHLYFIDDKFSNAAATYTAVATSEGGYAGANPHEKGWYERTGTDPNFTYRLTWDEAVVEGKTYYTKG